MDQEVQHHREREARVRLASLGWPTVDDTGLCVDGYAQTLSRLLVEHPDIPTYEEMLADAQRSSIRLVTAGDPEWPVSLNDLDCHAPEVLALWVAGQPLDLHQPITITGSRASTAYGNQMAYDLTAAGHTVITSLGFGIDEAALRGALSADGPGPVVVLAHGIQDQIALRPRQHEQMTSTLVRRGTIITEQSPGKVASRTTFLARSRCSV